MRRAIAAALAIAALLATPAARADDTDEVFARGAAALAEGRAGDAISLFESLADRGVVDAAVSFDRGLAYAARVRAGGEQPGDLGRAAQGFEEARALSPDPKLEADATRALADVRAEVARRRARAGESADVDQGPGLGRGLVRLLPEDAWAALALAASLVVGIGLFVRDGARARQLRAGAGVASIVAAPVAIFCAVMAFAARGDRLSLQEGVIVSATARPSDDKGIALPGAAPLPEAARVEIVDARAGWAHVRVGGTDAWIPASAVRPIARP